MLRKTLKTDRFIVRPLIKTDYQEWLDTYSGGFKKKSKFDESPYSVKECGKKLFLSLVQRHEKLANDDQVYVWFIFNKKTKKLVGYIDTWVLCRKEISKANVGYRVFNRYWRQGIASEVLSKMAPFMLKTLRLNRLEAAIDLDNRPSIKLVKSLGFYNEGVRKNYWYQNNRWEDQVVFVADRALYSMAKLKL